MAFLVRPLPFLEESLSSWRFRAGLANGFSRFALAPRENAAGDPDCMPDMETLDWISANLGAEHYMINRLCLERFSNRVFLGSPSQPHVRWISSCRPSRFGGSLGCYCPCCLMEDDTPHFRIAWRLAFTTHCPKHRCLLCEGCPQCGEAVWPTASRQRGAGAVPSTDLAHCICCHFDLRTAAVTLDDHVVPCQTLWEIAAGNDRATCIPDGATAESFFAGVWLLCRLLRREWKSMQQKLPVHFGNVDTSGWASAGSKFEQLPILQRAAITSASIWLLEEWPARLIEFGRTIKLPGEAFHRGEFDYPPWLDHVLKEHFLARNRWAGRREVAAAVQKLQSIELPVTKNALRRVLGVRENWAINELLDQRRHGSSDELVVLARRFEDLLAHTPPSRDQQRTLARDFLMLLCTACSGRNVEHLCEMDRQGVAEVIEDGGPKFEDHYLSDLMVRLANLYETGIRPAFSVRGDATEYWFISRFGKKLEGHSVRERIAKLMRLHLDNRLWNSADSFQSMFSGMSLVGNGAAKLHC